MSPSDQNQIPVAYPPAVQGVSYMTAVAPPEGYPARDGTTTTNKSKNQGPVETRSRGDGFWKGCCAALCCCCMLDVCF